ncbi:VOC family protein [Phycicoccus sp.]|uniref:VOC family protein n=1 Tax=Phycicoccus sp. TaxID=1902410 RepID=UPI002BC05EBC|nr:VOC family protein [Phycicoccus sp.]HMM95788.1 VOC family protein [Phycicoccus sp.]
MASQLTPYLNFPGTAREAMSFYQQVLGGDLDVMTFGQYGVEGPGADGVMHAHLRTADGFVIMASDLPPGQEEVPSGVTNVHVSLSGDDAALRGYWDGLADGATVTMPLEKQMWGDEFGALTDRFGISWMVNIGTGEGTQG